MRSSAGPDGGGAERSGGADSRPAWLRPVLRLGVLIVGVLLGGAGAYFFLERPALETSLQRLQANEVELAAVNGRLEQASLRVVALEGRLLVEESTRRGLESALRATQEELGRARDAVAFYEQLLPPGPKGVVTIRALDVERVGPHLSYRLLLMRSGSNAEPFVGKLQFLAKGRLGIEEVELPLSAAAPGSSQDEGQETDDDVFEVEFEDFQRGSGLLVVPENFEPAAITVNVLEGRHIRASRTLELALVE